MRSITSTQIDPAGINRVPRAVAEEYQIIPIKMSGQTVTIAMADVRDLFTLDNLRFIIHADVDCVLATPEDVLDAIQRHYPVE